MKGDIGRGLPPTALRGQRRRLMPPTVLIADDERDIATILAYAVRMVWPGGRVAVVADGAAALTRFAADSPDVVILDIAMPPPDGFIVLERIRAVSAAPVLMLTARADTRDRDRAFALGATDYMTKPFDHRDLLDRLHALLPPQQEGGYKGP
ncbi:MAG: response regulator [Chloroflexi bacterium]|nr:response regulator [Chloroflexota bacterium]